MGILKRMCGRDGLLERKSRSIVRERVGYILTLIGQDSTNRTNAEFSVRDRCKRVAGLRRELRYRGADRLVRRVQRERNVRGLW